MNGDTLSTVISKSYTDMIVADFTGKGDTQDLVLALRRTLSWAA